MTNKRTRGPQKLTPKQQQILLEAGEAHDAYVSAKRTLQFQLEQRLREELAEYENRRDALLYAADEAGVPRLRIARDALGVTGVNKLYDILKAQAYKRELALPELKVIDAEYVAQYVRINASAMAFVTDGNDTNPVTHTDVTYARMFPDAVRPGMPFQYVGKLNKLGDLQWNTMTIPIEGEFDDMGRQKLVEYPPAMLEWAEAYLPATEALLAKVLGE